MPGAAQDKERGSQVGWSQRPGRDDWQQGALTAWLLSWGLAGPGVAVRSSVIAMRGLDSISGHFPV